MKTTTFFIIVLSAMLSFAQDKMSTVETDQKTSHIQMHEQMSKAHQQAAECLKSGKSEDECRKAFHDMCKEFNGSEHCGPGMMHHKKMGRKGK